MISGTDFNRMLKRHPFPYFNLRQWILAIIVATVVTGCATPTPPPATDWDLHRNALEAITHVKAKGKVAFISPQERFSANFVWEENNGDISLRLTNFLGATLLTMNIDDRGARVIDNDGNEYRGENADLLLARLTGFMLPVAELPDWLIGLPNQNEDYVLGTDHRLKSLNYGRWNVDYSRYDAASKPALPSQMTLSDGQQRVKLAVSDWTIIR